MFVVPLYFQYFSVVLKYFSLNSLVKYNQYQFILVRIQDGSVKLLIHINFFPKCFIGKSLRRKLF